MDGSKGPSDSEGRPLLILDRTIQPKARGSALLGECDRAGFTELFTAAGRSVILPTTCKTWGCIVCQKKLLGLFKARVEVGVSTLGRCGFMTITYLADSERVRDAACVRKDWQALWRSLKRSGQQWKWLKVTELTKRGIPHHHIVLGPMDPTQQMRCHGRSIRKGKETRVYISRIPTCTCLSHRFARAWVHITGDSFMCFATEVTSAVGAASYMAKYMQKTFLRKGYDGRRFSTSRDWPGGERIRLRVTQEGGWSHIRRWPLSHFPSTENLNPREEDLLDRVGDDITIAIMRRKQIKAAERLYRKVVQCQSV